jgi:Transcriptional regulator
MMKSAASQNTDGEHKEPLSADPKSRPETLERRAEILRAATQVFAAKGFANATLAEVAELCGITRAGVLHHFGSKRNLLIETLKFRDARGLSSERTVPLPSGRAMFDHLIETAFLNMDRKGIVQAFVVLSAESVTEDSPAKEYFYDRYRILRAEIAENVMALGASQNLGEKEANFLASSIMAVMDGLQIQWLLSPDAVNLAEASQFAIRALVDGALPQT